MNTKNFMLLSGAIVVVVVLAIAGFMIGRTPTTATPSPAVSISDTQVSQNKMYTLAEVATHKDSSSCWTVVEGKVYDLTPFISKHEGGAANILRLCGIDGTQAYTEQHGGQRRPASELSSLQIGTLAN